MIMHDDGHWSYPSHFRLLSEYPGNQRSFAELKRAANGELAAGSYTVMSVMVYRNNA